MKFRPEIAESIIELCETNGLNEVESIAHVGAVLASFVIERDDAHLVIDHIYNEVEAIDASI
jgi:hypothetical protein